MAEGYGFFKGAIIGGTIGGIAALLLAPKAGSELIEDILDTYEKAQKNGHDFVDAIKEKSNALANIVSSKEEEAMEEEEETSHYPMLLGGALGAILIGIATIFVTSSSGKKFRRTLGKQYDDIIEKAEDFAERVEKKGEYVMDEVNDWKDTLSDLITKLSHNTKGKHGRHSKIDDVLDLANAGVRLYQQFQNRR